LLRYSQAAIERNATTERRQPENLEIPDGSAGSRGVQDLIPGPSPAASKVSTGGPRRIEAGGIGYAYFSTPWRIPSLPVPKTSAVSLAPRIVGHDGNPAGTTPPDPRLRRSDKRSDRSRKATSLRSFRFESFSRFN